MWGFYMRFYRDLDNILGQRSKIKILRFLINTNQEHNGREIAKAIDSSPDKVHSVSKELVEQGIVQMRRVGKALLYKVSIENSFVKNTLAILFENERRLIEHYVQYIVSKLSPKPISIILFGSIAKYTGKPNSDVDLLFISRNNERHFERKIEEITPELVKKFGNRPSVIVWTQKEFMRRYRSQEPFIKRILQDGIWVWGKKLSEVINYGK